LINTGLYADNAPALSFSAEHWVRLVKPIEGVTMGGTTYYRRRVYDPAKGGETWLPSSGGYQHKNAFLGHFYGYVAARR